MITARRSDDALATFAVQGMPAHALQVARWHGTEAISQPSRFAVTLACEQHAPDVAGLVGRRATLRVQDDNGEHPWHGVITSLVDLGESSGRDMCEAILEPRLALLREFRRSEVFLDRDVADLIRQLLAQCGLRHESDAQAGLAEPFDFALHLSARTRELTRQSFTCQFEESSLDFLSRRLEREGIYYWFEQQAEGEAVVFAESQLDHPVLPQALSWRPDSVRDTERGVAPVMRMTRHVGARPARVRVGDFAASRADMDLSLAVPVPGEATQDDGQDPAVYAEIGEQAVYGDHYDGHAAGQRLARIRAQAIACASDRFEGASRVPALRPGFCATLRGHTREAYNTGYCVTAVSHEGSQPLPGSDLGDREQTPGNYQNQFHAILQSTQFRTPRQTRWPRIIGMVSAVIEAEGSGQYAELNEHGCYKVRFPFASTQRAASHNSAWVRMATPYAGNGHGMHLPLLKGTEVLVSFISGDPDRPVITAAIPNSENPNMLDGASASQPGLRTAGGNTLSFEDRDGRQSALLGSPVGQSHIAFGAGEGTNGIQLQSHDHVGMASSSYQQTVPGIYRMRVMPLGSSLLGDKSTDATSDPTDTTPGDTPPTAAAASTPSTDDDATKTNKSLSTTWWNGFGAIKSNVGLIVTDYIGSASSVYLGNQNSMCVGIKTDITIAASFGLAVKGGKVVTLFDHLTFDATKYSKKVKEDITVGKSDLLVGEQTIKVVTKTENLGTYTGTALGMYQVQGLALHLKTTSQSTQLHLDPAAASLGAMDLTLEGALATSLGGMGGSITTIKGGKVNVGMAARTASLALSGTTIQMNFQASADVNGSGALSLAGGLVRIG